MKMVHAKHESHTEGAQAVKQTGVGGDAKIVYALLTGMVKDKIIYPVREYATNAWEVSPPTKPFEIELPNKFNLEYRIRDFGPGLGHRFMMDRYAKIGDSTKDDDDEAVGGWGFGSKSGLAYLLRSDGCGSLSVTSRHKGFRRAYIVGVSDKGKIQIQFLGEWPLEPEDRGTGLEISFAVHPDDVDRFRECAEDVLWSFHPRPKVIPALDFGEPKVAHKGDGWTLYHGDSVPFSGPQVQIGPVRYRIDLSLAPRVSKLVTFQDHIVFNAPVGTLSVSASREDLQYDDRTLAGLRALFEHYEQDWMAKAREAVDAEKSYFDAYWRAKRIADSLGMERGWAITSQIGWRGFSFNDALFRPRDPAKALRWNYHHNRKPAPHENFTFKPDWGINPGELGSLPVVIQHNTSRSMERLELAGLMDEKFLWVRCRKADLAETLALMGSPEYRLLDEVKLPPRAPGQGRQKRPENIKRLRVLNDELTSSEGVLLDTDEELVYCRVEGRGHNRTIHTYVDGTPKELTLDQARRHLKTVRGSGLMDYDTPIVMLRFGEEPRDHWRPLGDHIVELADEALDPSQVAPVIPWSDSSFPALLKQVQDYEVDLGCAPQALRDIFYQMVGMGQHRVSLDREPTVHDDYADLLLKLSGRDVKLKENDPTAPLREAWVEIENSMPALEAILDQHNESNYVTDPVTLKSRYRRTVTKTGQRILDHYWLLLQK